VQGWQLARDLTVAGVSALFSLWITFVSGYQAVYDALVVVLAGVILYAFLTARREDVGQIPEPVDNPPDDTSAISAEAPATAGYAPVAAGQSPAPAGSNE